MKYRFARFYLGGMLLCAILVISLGVIGAIGYWTSAVSAVLNIQSIRTKPYFVNTAAVVDELSMTSRLLAKRLGSARMASVQLPVADRFTVGPSESLAAQQVAAFVQFLDRAATARDSLKAVVTGSIEQSLLTLMHASADAIPKTVSNGHVASRPQPDEHVLLDQLYDPLFLTEERLTELRSLYGFLDGQVTRYTPSKDALALAEKANADLQIIIDLMAADLKANQVHGRSLPEFEQQEAPIVRTASEQDMLIRDFVGKLELALGIVKGNGLQKWRLDTTLNEARSACNNEVSARAAEVDRLKAQCWVSIKWGGAVLLVSLVVSLLLLALRDFMSAVIDTASNTGEMVDRLSKLTTESN